MISDRLKQVVLRQLQLEDAMMNDSTVASEVPGWDSLSHVRILAAVENEFSVRFRPLEVLQLKTVGDLQRLIDKKIAQTGK